MRLICSNKSHPIRLFQKRIVKCPRVGLTLRRHDVYREKQFWMADYRCITFPALHTKMREYIILSMIRDRKSKYEICVIAGARLGRIEELEEAFLEGKRIGQKGRLTILQFHNERMIKRDSKMKACDWARVYGMHQALVSKGT